MSKKFSASMFDELKGAMSEHRTGGNFKDILKCSVGNSYLVRLIPNVDDISKTIHHYFNHGWKSLATGQFVSTVCPTTIGQRCPICEERVRLYRGDEDDKANAKLLGRKEQWLANVYVVDDPTTEENTNTIKILRYGKQIDKIIRDATEGIDKDEFGARIFDLTEEGCNLRIMVEKNDGGFPTYVSSKFLRESEIEDMTEAKIEGVYEDLFQLEKVFELKSVDEVKELLDTHFFCQVTNTTTATLPESTGVELSSSGDVKPEPETEPEVEKNVEAVSSNDDEAQKKIDDLLADLT